MEEAIGGQAVIEGVMFKSKNKIGVAVRNPNGNIVVSSRKFKSLTKNKILGLPLLRGVIILFETLIEGIKTLNYSANVNAELDEKNKMDVGSLIITMVLSLGLALFLFKFIPLLITNSIGFENKYWFNAVEGLIKLAILILYIYLISLMPDIKRVFEYHGAEHKVINAYENNDRIDIRTVKKYSTIHPRCGTSFIIFVIFLSIIAYIFIPMNYSFWIKLGLRILLLPFIAGMAYELIRLSGRFKNSKILFILIIPGLLLQRLTTKEPNTKQLEVSIRAFKEVQ